MRGGWRCRRGGLLRGEWMGNTRLKIEIFESKRDGKREAKLRTGGPRMETKSRR